MRVTVMTPARSKIPLEGVETLRDVKKQVLEKTGIPVRQQLIYFRGRLLKSLRRSLASYRMKEDSTVYLVKKLKVCRCLACRNSRYIEREEIAEEQELLRELLGDPPEAADPESEATAEMDQLEEGRATDVSLGSVGLGGAETEESPETLDVWLDALEHPEDLEDIQTAVPVDEDYPEDETEEVGGEVEVEMEGYEEAEETENTETAAEVEWEPEVEGEPEEIEEPEDPETIEVAGESEVIELCDDIHDLDAEDADDEEEPEEEDVGEETDRIEDIEEEPVVSIEEEEEEAAQEAPAEDDDDANILYSLAPSDNRTNRQQQTERTARPAEDEDEEHEDGPPEVVFLRQAAFEEDGANSVGEENPDIADAEDELDEPAAPVDPDPLPSDENILLAMTRPSRVPDPDGDPDPADEDPFALPAELDDPLYQPPDEDDPGYVSGDEREDA